MNEKKTGWVPKTFKDAGTGEIFEGGKEHSFEPGAFANYVAGKKVLAERPKSAKAEAKSPGATAA